MPNVIDSHCHVFAFDFEKYFPGKSREIGRFWAKSVSHAMHGAQPLVRFLPEPFRKAFDELAGIFPTPFLLFESGVKDLIRSMDRSGVDQAVVIAHPAYIQNEWLLEICRENPRMIPAVKLAADCATPEETLEGYVRAGAKVLKFHPASDGLDAESEHYLRLLKVAQKHNLPIILHTGCLHSHILYKNPEASDASLFETWFEEYPDLRFILAHMNFHDPEIAIDLGERYENVFLETSWQPVEAITEAVRRLGAKKVLFGSDWPLMGENMEVGVGRVRSAAESQFITHDDAIKILGENAEALLGLTVKPA